MRLALVTWIYSNNYGTALQVAAMTHVLESLGHTVDVVDYRKIREIVQQRKIPLRSYFVKKVRNKLKSTGPLLEHPERDALCKSFFDGLNRTAACDTYSDFRELNHQYDAFLCGSDQVWAPTCFDSRYFLDFVEDPQKAIAYAPSVGLPRIADGEVAAEIAKYTSRIGYLSTRESQGSEIIAKLTGRNVETVLDPTLLLSLEQWRGLLPQKQAEHAQPYLLAYFLGNNPDYWKAVYQTADFLDLTVKVVPVFARDAQRKGCIAEGIGPEEFFCLVDGAGYICTDSFHGTLFSINLNKRFTTFLRFKDGDANDQNSRVHNILRAVNLEKRIFNGKNAEQIASGPVDYESVNQTLRSLRQGSMDYLVSALEGVRNHNAQKKKAPVADVYCCGCGACAAVCPVNAISIVQKQGYYKTEVNMDSCIHCGKCTKTCPMYGPAQDVALKTARLYSYKDGDREVLTRSTSGGAAYRLAQMMNGGGMAVAGCEFSVAEQRAKHIVIDPGKPEELKRLQGSKYMQSRFHEALWQVKESDRPAVIFGTPCQIAGARRLLKDRQDIIYVDLICHGVPPRMLLSKYADYLEREHGIDREKLDVVCRSKIKGWRERYIYSTDGAKSHLAHQSKDPMFLLFESGLCYSEACYECRWRNSSEADIRLGDFWGSKYADDTTGVSMVAVFTDRGEELVRALQETGRVIEERIEDYYAGQQTENYALPVCHQRLLADLEDPDMTIEAISNAYAVPVLREKQLAKAVHTIKGVLRRHG